MAEWDAELSIDPEVVRQAAGRPRAWRLLGIGWDCDAWIADESMVWRVPRRQVGIAALEREAAFMPKLARRLPVRVPEPVLVEAPGVPALARHALVPGREMAEAGADGAPLGASIGRFLRALHDPELPEQVGEGLPVDPIHRGDPTKRVPFTHRRLDDVSGLVDVERLRPIVEAGAGPPLPATSVCHGDLHLRHVLVDPSGDLAGVIDWGDLCLGARAMDLAIVTALDREGRSAFFASYGQVDEASFRHARLLGVMLAASLLAADPAGTVGGAARRWLDRLAEPETLPSTRST